MGFNSTTLLSLIFGLLVPLLILVFFAVSKHRKEIAFDSVFYGFGSFIVSIISVVFVFLIVNMVALSGITFESESDQGGLALAAAVLCALVAVIFAVCESLKLITIKKFRSAETRFRYSGLGFAAGVILAQNVAVFIALNVVSSDGLVAGFAIFSGAAVCVTGIMYAVISHACDVIFETSGNGPAYALSAVYYLFWIAAVLCSSANILLYVMLALFFVLSFVLSGVFVVRKDKFKRNAGDKA